MRDQLTYDEILEKLPAYALGALEAAEMLEINAYIHRHEALLARLEEAEQATAQLAYLAPATPLPADAKDRLLNRVRADLKTEDAPEAKAELRHPDRSTPQPQQPRWAGLWAAINRRTGWILATGAVMLLLAIIAGVYAVQTQARLRQVSAERDNLQAELVQLEAGDEQQQALLRQAEADLAALQAEIARLQTNNAELEQVNQNLREQLETENSRLNFVAHTTPDRTVLLPGTEEAPQAHGLLYLGTGDNQALLVLSQLSPLPPQETYQLWLIPQNEDPVPAGLLSVQSDEPTWLRVEIPPEAEQFSAVGVSREPSGGSPAPTGPIVLLGTVS